MYAFPLRLYGRRMHVCNLKKSYYEGSDPFHQFFVQESQGNQEILKIFDDTNFVSLNGTADFSLQKAICTISEQKDFPKDRILPGNSDLQQAFIKLKFEPELNSGSGLLLKKGEQNGSKSLKMADDQLFFSVAGQSSLILKKDKAKDPKKHLDRIYLEIEFQAPHKGPSYLCTLVIHIITEKDSQNPLYRGIIDFGSDSLQMRIINPHGKKDDVDILSRIAEDFYGYKEGELRRKDGRKMFYQELEDESLFKSDIFIKNKHGKSGPNDPPGQPGSDPELGFSLTQRVEDSEELVNVLTSKQIEDLWAKHRFLAPNLKLAALKDFFNKRIQFEKEEDNPDPMGSKDVSFSQLNHLIYRIALNKFLHTLFKVIRKATRERISPYVHLTLLVPNVYRQSLIHELIEGLLKDWQKDLYESYQFAGLEIQILSESDATFLGMLNELDPQYQDQFLIIDGGKGTTDISIIRVDKENEEGDIKSYSSIYRDGFIGAGNLISYSFIETVLAIFYSEDANKRREFMETYLLSHSSDANLNEIIEFLSLIEQLKISFNDPATQKLKADEIRTRIKEAYVLDPAYRSNMREDGEEISLTDYVDKNESNSPLATLNKWIINIFKIENYDRNSFQRSFSIQDDFGFIEQQVEEMAETFCQNLSSLKVDGKRLKFKKILFAGRSFLFQDLLKKMKEKLSDFVWETEGLADSNFMTMANNPKKVCLHGALGQQEINHLSSLIGIPFVNQIEENKPHINGEKKEEKLNGESTEPTSKLQNGKKALNKFQNQLKPVGDWFKRNFVVHLSRGSSLWHNRNISEVDINFFLSGSNIIPRGSTVFINGDKVNIEKWMQGHDFKLFYGGEDFYCRILDEDGRIKETRKIGLQLEDTSQKDGLLIKSVFPFIELGGSKLPISVIDHQALKAKEEHDKLARELAEKYLGAHTELPNMDDIFSADPILISEELEGPDEEIKEESLELVPVESFEQLGLDHETGKRINGEKAEEILPLNGTEHKEEENEEEESLGDGIGLIRDPQKLKKNKPDDLSDILGI